MVEHAHLQLVVYSGGMDSLTLLDYVTGYTSLKQPFFVSSSADLQRLIVRRHSILQAISFDYGQRHVKELDYAKHVCEQRGIKHHVIDMRHMRPYLRGSSQTDDGVDVPEGAYDAPTMKLTVVPGRNTMMLSMALALAEAQLNLFPASPAGINNKGSASIYFGAHAGDHHIYPDCRPEYVDALARAFYLASEGRVELLAPFLHKTKGEIVRIGKALGTRYEDSWTCYKGGDRPCGVCGSCNERAEAFAFAGIPDPALTAV